MSAEGQAITLLRTQDAHLSKAFEDEWEQLGANEYHDNAEGIAHSARIQQWPSARATGSTAAAGR